MVAVLITNCHVSLKWKRGPVTTHPRITTNAIRKAQELPVQRALARAKRPNHPLFFISLTFPFLEHFFITIKDSAANALPEDKVT